MPNSNFKGGLKIDNPYPSNEIDLIRIPLPDKVVLPMQQRIGNQAIPCVSIGEHVLTGQIIATIDDDRCAPVHASISGTVSAIGNHVYAHQSGLKGLCVTIESDGNDEWVDTSIGCTENYKACLPLTIYDKIRISGIVGMGGAGFPTHTKMRLAAGCKNIIINATECEPGITCDAALMEAYPTKVIRGIEVLLHISGAEKAIIAIEDDKQDSINELNKYCNNERIEINVIPTKYTSGAEKILIKTLLGVEVPSGKFASDIGILCLNVATVVAMFDAVVENRPLISRAVTLAGSAIKEPKNLQVRLGATYEYLLSFVDLEEGSHKVTMAGLMMGINLKGTDYSVSKNTNCIFIDKAQESVVAQECIRCGLCNTVCPVELLPQQLYWFSKSENIEKAMDYNLLDCIECGCCSYVCPSNIPLVNYYQFSKALYKKQIQEKAQIEKARERFEFREMRLERNKRERAELMEAKKIALKEKMAKDKAQKEKIDAALERVNAAKINNKEEDAS